MPVAFGSLDKVPVTLVPQVAELQPSHADLSRDWRWREICRRYEVHCPCCDILRIWSSRPCTSSSIRPCWAIHTSVRKLGQPSFWIGGGGFCWLPRSYAQIDCNAKGLFWTQEASYVLMCNLCIGTPVTVSNKEIRIIGSNLNGSNLNASVMREESHWTAYTSLSG